MKKKLTTILVIMLWRQFILDLNCRYLWYHPLRCNKVLVIL